MEFILLAAILFSLIAQVVLMRFFFKQLLEKLSKSLKIKESVKVQRDSSSMPPLSQFPWQGNFDPLIQRKPPADLPNDVVNEDTNLTDFDENVPMPGIDSTLKFEVEGGDSNVPPGFEVKQ